MGKADRGNARDRGQSPEDLLVGGGANAAEEERKGGGAHRIGLWKENSSRQGHRPS
uniref:Splicing factor suppressor of white-apricot homolog isoform X1 n=1 Tax=Rhizophora mucronata TaxID=61149 RepID=A0A2P2JW93_RHIMU